MEPQAPANFTPLVALPAMALGLETSGADARDASVKRIVALGIQGAQSDREPLLDATLENGAIGGHLEALREALAGRVVIGHQVAFDLAVLRHSAARAGIAWTEPPRLDLTLLCAALEPGLSDYGPESLADWLGVEVTAPHTAVGNCLTAARIWQALCGRLREQDVRTLGEARGLCERRADMMESQERAGWNAVPEGAAPASSMRPMLRLDAGVYAQRLEDVMHGPPLAVAPDATLREAAALMVESRVGSLLILGAGGAPAGILTERDLLRTAARTTPDLSTLHVSEAMSTPVETMGPDEMLYRALGRMSRKGIRHLCVVDDDGRAVGMVSQRDVVGARMRSASALGDAIEEAMDGAALAAIHGQLPAVAEALVDDGLTGIEVARVVSNEIRALTGRAADLAARRLFDDGRGAAPARWCVMVLGSAGRGESLLSADQDHALVHDGEDGDDAWFASMGEGIAELLDQAGVPLCSGGVMASKTPWRGTVDDWRQRIGGWLGKARPEDLLNVDIFFDLVPVAGDAGLARALQLRALEEGRKNPTFMALLAESVSRVTPTLGFFGQLPVEDGRVDLKRHGLLPLVSMARLLAIKAGSSARSTPERLLEVAEMGRLSAREARRLVRIHGDLLTRVLKQQLDDLHAGVRPSGRVAVNALSREERKQLAADLKDLASVVGEVRSLVSG